MPSINVPASDPATDNDLIIAFMPNRGRTRFLRGVVLIFLAIGALGCLSLLFTVVAEFYARHSWPIARGVVIASGVRSNKDRPGNLNRRATYWVEYELKFSVPVTDCRTGTTSADSLDPTPCWGTVTTRSTDSWSTANHRLLRHPLNSEVSVLHDPSGPNIKIAGESPWFVYPWKSIFGMLIWMAVFSVLLNITQRRLRILELLPEGYDASPPPSQTPRSDDLIDMNLS